MKSPMLLGHWQAVGHLCPSVYEELQPFAENSIVTDVNFYRKVYQAKESISFLPMFSKFRWCVRKQRLASVFDRIFLFSTSMPANERQQPHFPLVITGVKTQEMCVCVHMHMLRIGWDGQVWILYTSGWVNIPAIQTTPKSQWLKKIDLFLHHTTYAWCLAGDSAHQNYVGT